MNLNTVLDIFGSSIEILTKSVEDRRNNSTQNQQIIDRIEDDDVIHIGEPNLEVVLQKLLQIKLLPEEENIMVYGGALYDELFDRVIANRRRGVQASIIDILKPFKEYSHSMYPETLYQEKLNILDRMTNEECAKYFYDPTTEMIANAKAIRIADEKRDAYARGEYFKPYITTIITNDILRKAIAYLHWYVIDFAVMLDCVLLHNGYDLLELQNLHNIKLIDEHKEILLSRYIGSDRYTKQLLSKVCNVEKSDAQYSNLIPELEGEEAKRYLTKAIELGVMAYEQGVFKWLRSNVLLAIFMGVIICGDSVNDTKWGGPKWRVTTKTFPDAGLEKMFGIKNLGQQRVNNLDNERQKNPPRGYEEIMKIFD